MTDTTEPTDETADVDAEAPDAPEAPEPTAESTRARITAELRESAQKIWLAGLGAMATAESEGSKLFQTLVERGESYEGVNRERVAKVRERATETAGAARQKADDLAEKIGKTVDEKVTAALGGLGIPTRVEIETLTQRVAELTERLDGLRADPPAEEAPAPAPKKRKRTKKAAKATKPADDA